MKGYRLWTFRSAPIFRRPNLSIRPNRPQEIQIQSDSITGGNCSANSEYSGKKGWALIADRSTDASGNGRPLKIRFVR
jgi:hypothetical protein